MAHNPICGSFVDHKMPSGVWSRETSLSPLKIVIGRKCVDGHPIVLYNGNQP